LLKGLCFFFGGGGVVLRQVMSRNT